MIEAEQWTDTVIILPTIILLERLGEALLTSVGLPEPTGGVLPRAVRDVAPSQNRHRI